MTEYFVLLTVIAPVGAEYRYHTLAKKLQFPANATPVEIYQAAHRKLPSHMQSGNVVFYDARPNHPAAGRAS